MKPTLANYRIEKTIGEGTFGKVKLAIHNTTKEKVAIKVLKKSCFTDSSDIERVTREIYILKLVDHPNLVHLYEIIDEAEKIFVIMEFVSGGELFEYIEAQGKLEETEACRLFQQVLSAVEYLHGQNIAHRDLKPENMLLDYQKNVKIVDFGLSNLYKPGSKLKSSCGSPCYAAPEMVLNKLYDPVKVDIWSLGIVLYQMVCGSLPFEDENTTKLYNKIVAGKFTMPKSLSNSCQTLIKALLTPDPAIRISFSEIKSSVFYSICTQSLSSGIIKGFDGIPVVKDIERILRTYNVDVQATFEAVAQGKHDRNTTIYYLVLFKFLMTGEKPKHVCVQGVREEVKGNSFVFGMKGRTVEKKWGDRECVVIKEKGHRRVLTDHLPYVRGASKGNVTKRNGKLRMSQENRVESKNSVIGKVRKKVVSFDEGKLMIFRTR